MGLLEIILIFVGILVILELFKHHFTKGLLKYGVAALILLFVFLLVSAYFDLGTFFSKDNTFAKTGAVIADDVSEDLEHINIDKSKTVETLGDKIKEMIRNLLDS